MGKIINVYPYNLCVDVYLFDRGSLMTNIPLCLPSRGGINKGIFMPSKGEICLVLRSNQGKYFALSTTLISPIDMNEPIFPGENVTESSGGAFNKQDMIGNYVMSAGFGNAIILGNNGVNNFYSIGKQEVTASAKKISGISINKNYFNTTSSLASEKIKVLNYEEYTDSLSLPKIYKPLDAISSDGTRISINQTIKSEIISSAQNNITKIQNFNNSIEIFRNDIKNPSLTPTEIATKIAEFNTSLYNEYGAGKTTMLIVEKGHAVNKTINNINDLSDLAEVDFAKSPEGNDICFRITLPNPLDASAPKAQMYLDTAGNLHIKSKKFIVDAEEYEFNEI
jgi:hypothetical protein